MSEENNNYLIIYEANGKKILFENAKVVSIVEDKEDIMQTSFELEGPLIEERGCLEFSIEIKGLKKKRFIKLLMSKGLQKNEAISFSKFIHRKYKSYSQLYLLLADIYLKNK